MNISAKFQPSPLYNFWGVDFWILFRSFRLKLRDFDKKYTFGREPLNKHS